MTAVEFLYERLERMIPRTALYNMDKEDYFKQAKEMEQHQIIDAYIEGYSASENLGDSQQYYEETHGDK